MADPIPSFKVFLSHRYRSPETNLFFFNLFAEQARLQFEVDEGVSYRPVGGGELVHRLPTNVTRLERMVRGADAFIGIYPLPLAAAEAPSSEQLLAESRYFRLELELAIRAGKPAFLVYDARYKSLLDYPSIFFRCAFDAQEIGPEQTPSSAAGISKIFGDFCRCVAASNAYRVSRGAPAKSARVGLLLPPRGGGALGYGEEHFGLLEAALRENNYDPVRLPSPPTVGKELLFASASLDWLILDVGDDPPVSRAAAFLHGQFLPALRLDQRPPGAASGVPGPAERSASERTLYGGVDVGYPKDIVRWQSSGELDAGVRARIQVIDLPARRINTRAQAEEYFGATAKLPLNLFLSYAGRDEAVAGPIGRALEKRFQKVFNYKDGTSIRPGEPWLAEIFNQLAEAAVAVPLLSDEYFASGNCEHEARAMIARRDNNALHVIPVKVTPKVLAPTWFADLQFERLFASNGDVEALADEIVGLVRSRQANAAIRAPGVPV